MSVENFIPTVWDSGFLEAARNEHVYAAPEVCNRDYEGEIQTKGDSVKINSIGDIETKDYDGSPIDGPDDIVDASQTLHIDQAKYVNFKIDDVDKVQASEDLLEEASTTAGYALRDDVDTFMSSHFTDVPAGNMIGTDGAPITLASATPKDAYNTLVQLRTKLVKQNCPLDGIWTVVDPLFTALLLQDDRFVSFGTSENRSTLENGKVGRAAGFTIFESNQVPNIAGTKYKLMAGHKSAWSFAEQLLETEAYRPEAGFSDAVKSLHVYGGKVVRPERLAMAVANFS